MILYYFQITRCVEGLSTSEVATHRVYYAFAGLITMFVKDDRGVARPAYSLTGSPQTQHGMYKSLGVTVSNLTDM